MKTTTITKVVIIGLLLLVVPAVAMAQPAAIPHHKEAYILESGEYSGLADPAAKSFVAFRQVVRISEAPWLQLHFGKYNLGEQSYITITSLKDGHKQRLDAKSLRHWQGSTAYFNGDAVQIELHVAPEEKGISVSVKEVTAGERTAGDNRSPTTNNTCGGTDDRVASNDPRVGRVMPVGCTGWIISNGAYLTAGHCAVSNNLPPAANLQTLQFNVPASNANGTINHPPPQDQYPIIAGAINFAPNGVGNDWAVFDCGPNANTGLLPTQAQNAFFRLSRDTNPSIVRVTGYGVDGPAPNFGEGIGAVRDADNQTQQTDDGPSLGEVNDGSSQIHFKYRVDTTGGTSGSPVIVNGAALAIAIHTSSDEEPCTGVHEARGTSFENNDLENAIQTFPGTGVQYVDQGHPATTRDGTVLRPRAKVNEAVSAAVSGGAVSIVTGSYSETMTITKPLRLIAPVGPVIIGN